MTTVSFPLTLTGSYTDGSVCSAADYRADFEKMRDAINHMHERFSSYAINGVHTHYQRAAMAWSIASGGTSSVDTYGVNVAPHPSGASTPYKQALGEYAPTHWSILNIFQVPSWMQGLRVRRINAVNLSKVPDQSGPDHDTTLIVYRSASSNHLTFSAGTSSTLSYFASGTTQPNVTDIGSATFETNAEIRGPDVAGSSASPVIKTVDANRVIPPGDYIAIRAKGALEFVDGSATPLMCYDLNWHFQVTLLCDAMVPVL